VKRIRSLGVGNSRRRFLLALPIVMMLVLSLSAAAQNQYYVSTSGSDSNDGTSPNTAWRHINKAIASFSPGTPVNGIAAVINVHAGTYGDENLSCAGYAAAICISRGGSSPSARLKIVCDTQWSVPSGSGCLLRNSSGDTGIAVNTNNVDIGGLNQFGFDYSNINHAYGITLPCGGLSHMSTGTCTTGNSVNILGNYLHDLSQTTPCEVNPAGHPGIVVNNNHGAKMDNVTIIGNRESNLGPQSQSRLNGGPGCFNYYGMYISSSGVKVQNNIAVNIAGYALHYYSAPCSAVISGNDFSRTEFPNIVLGGGDCGNGIPSGSNTISNNILGQTASGQPNIQVGVPGGGDVGSSSNPTLIANNIFSGSSTQLSFNTSGTQANSIVTNSRTEAPTTTFVNYTGGNYDDFTLKDGSIAIANGSLACASGGMSPCAPQFDINAIIRSNPPSVGVYEGRSSTGSVPSAPTGLSAQVQ
jgi:hypothetical protein